ncbi:unnamed protein product [Auanema sp. JU1783]|nr:unnamed protein product [Auanema sp. JU1783]
MRRCTLISISLFVSALLILGLFLLIPFPLAIFQKIVDSQVYIQRNSKGQFPKSTYYWSNLPAIQHFDFYFFNVTNPDEVLYNGAKAHVLQVGPYSYAEREFKENINWMNGDNMVYYSNNKTWTFDPQNSCTTCGYEDPLNMPNLPFMTLLKMKIDNNLNDFAVKVLDIFSLLLGEYPLRVVPMAGATFSGYNDPLIDFMNSNLSIALSKTFGISFPQQPAGGFFPYYNHTADGSYYTLTGKDNVNNLGLIQKWVNSSHLPWWRDDNAQDISNSGDGSFQKPNLKKQDQLKQFQSFVCRSFYLNYDSSVSNRNIPAYRFKMDDDTFDTTLRKNKGYQYENYEKIDYFPTWPCGADHQYNATAGCIVDCSQRENWCSSCCNGTHYKDTVFLPPGMFPLRCFPGKYELLPLAAFISPPHFIWSPPEVQENVYGLQPDPAIHHPGVFDINPVTGSTVGGFFRTQFNVPIYNSQQFTVPSTIRNSFIPCFWLNLRIEMLDYSHNYLLFNTVTLPHIILGVGIGLTAVACLLLVLLVICYVRSRRTKKSSSFEPSNGTYVTRDW